MGMVLKKYANLVLDNLFNVQILLRVFIYFVKNIRII